MTSASPVFPRVLVFIPDSGRSVPTTGWLERNAIGTIRCADVSFVKRAIRDAGPMLGAALIDADEKDAQLVERMIADALPTLPILRRAVSGGQHLFSFVRPTTDDFANRVLRVLTSRPGEAP